MPSASDSLPVLIALSGPLNGNRWVIQQPLRVGRGEDCDIVIPDRKISRHHAQFTPGTEAVLLEDLNSKNGTHHNGKPVKDAILLKDGDNVQIALAQKFTFLSSDATVPLDFALQENAEEGQSALELDKRSRRVWVLDQEITPPLSAAQFTLLENLYKSDGRVVAREKLVREIWGETEAYGVSDQALDALVRRLRDRLAALDKQHNYVVTVRGHGLRLDNPPR